MGLASVPPEAAAIVPVDATDDLAAVRAAVRELATLYGAPAAVVALKEDDLLVGGQLRQEWQCPGPRPHDLMVFRNKGAMCQAIHQAGLAVPAFAEAHKGRCSARLRRRPRVAGTDALLSLQRRPDEVIHRDELLFQTVHQSTELWLKLACSEVEEAIGQVGAGAVDTAARLLARATLGVEPITWWAMR